MPQRVNLNQDDNSVSNRGAGFQEAKPTRSSPAEAWKAVKQASQSGAQASPPLTPTRARHVPIEKGSYIAGFVDGEGSFYLSVRKRKDYRTGWKFSLHFNISNADKAVMEQCKKYLQCGKIRTIKKNEKPFYIFEVSDKNTLRTIIIPFFTRFSFLSNKKKAEFRVFDNVLYFMEQTPVCNRDSLEKLLEYRRQLSEWRSTQTHYSDSEIRASFRD
jgi:hypothetical protein